MKTFVFFLTVALLSVSIFASSEEPQLESQKVSEKHLKKMEKEKVVPETTQQFCPVMTGHSMPCNINNKVFTDYKGRRVYFCSEKCKETFIKDPEKYLKNFENKPPDSNTEKNQK